jgi:hypothetical protein
MELLQWAPSEEAIAASRTESGQDEIQTGEIDICL